MIISICAVLSLILLFILWLLTICPADAAEEMTTGFLGHAYAHRGLHSQEGNLPENSIPAFKLAAEYGYGIELDICLSKDGQVIVFHDETLKRICGVDRRIDEFTYDELKQFKLNGSDECIPLFRDALAAVNGRVPLIIEFKHTSDNKLLCKNAFKLLDNYAGPYCVESFNPLIVKYIRRMRPKVFRGQLSCRVQDKYNRFIAVLFENLMCNFISRPHFIAYAYKDMKNPGYRAATRLLHGIPVAWTVHDQEVFYKLYDEGIDMQIFEGFMPPAVIVDEEPDNPEEFEQVAPSNIKKFKHRISRGK